MSNKVTVKILLNTKDYSLPYQPGDQFRQALSFESGFPACGHIDRLLDIVFAQTNIDQPTAEWARQYRNEINRSLSVGDVIIVGETAYAVEPLGYRAVTINQTQVWVPHGVMSKIVTSEQD